MNTACCLPSDSVTVQECDTRAESNTRAQVRPEMSEGQILKFGLRGCGERVRSTTLRHGTTTRVGASRRTWMILRRKHGSCSLRPQIRCCFVGACVSAWRNRSRPQSGGCGEQIKYRRKQTKPVSWVSDMQREASLSMVRCLSFLSWTRQQRTRGWHVFAPWRCVRCTVYTNLFCHAQKDVECT